MWGRGGSQTPRPWLCTPPRLGAFKWHKQGKSFLARFFQESLCDVGTRTGRRLLPRRPLPHSLQVPVTPGDAARPRGHSLPSSTLCGQQGAAAMLFPGCGCRAGRVVGPPQKGEHQLVLPGGSLSPSSEWMPPSEPLIPHCQCPPKPRGGWSGFSRSLQASVGPQRRGQEPAPWCHRGCRPRGFGERWSHWCLPGPQGNVALRVLTGQPVPVQIPEGCHLLGPLSWGA